MKKRMLSLFLVMVMLFTMMPTAFATDGVRGIATLIAKDKAGNPLPGVAFRVNAKPATGDTRTSIGNGVTDANGRVNILIKADAFVFHDGVIFDCDPFTEGYGYDMDNSPRVAGYAESDHNIQYFTSDSSDHAAFARLAVGNNTDKGFSFTFVCTLTAPAAPEEPVKPTFDVTWLDWNGTELKSVKDVTEEPEAPAAPTRESDAQYTYKFDKWEKSADGDGNITYTATYKETVNKYDITWVVDGESTVEAYEYGVTPNFKGSTDKAADDEYIYEFAGWNPEIVEVTGKATYTAEFTSTPKHVCADNDGDGFCSCGACMHEKGEEYCAVEGCQHPEKCACNPAPAPVVTERSITVTVVDENGYPVEGIGVQLWQNARKTHVYETDHSVLGQKTTNANGKAVFGDDILAGVQNGYNLYAVIVSDSYEWAERDAVRTAQVGTNTKKVLDAGNEEYLQVTANAGFDGAFTCYAKQSKFKLDYVQNGGELQDEPAYTAEGLVAAGTGLNLPEITKTGYTFEGWYADEVFEIEAPAKMPAEELVLYAKWAPITYTLVYHGNEGVLASNPEMDQTTSNVKYDAEITFKNANTFTRTGYTLVEWNTAADGSGASYDSEEKGVKNLADEEGEKVDLYAIWAPIPYTLLYHGNEGVLASNPAKDQTTSTVKYDAEIFFKNANTFKRAGYTFVEWNTAADGSGTPYDPEVKGVKNLASEQGAKVDLYAIWAPITYTVKFDGNGATAGEMADQSFNYDEAAKALTKNAFAKTGYHFVGWNTAANGSGDSYTDGQSVQNLTAEENGVVTLYAQWEINEYTVTFDSKGGSDVDGQTVEHGQKATEPADPTRSGHKFRGWTLDGKLYDFNTEVTGDITLEALWSKKSSSSKNDDYKVIIEKTKNGDVESNRTYADKGDIITITVDPDKGYEVDDITVTKKNGDEIKVTKKSASKYTFKMPAADVYVDVDFEKEAAWPFADVDKDDVCYDAVKFMYENGLMAGVGDGTKFAPDMDLSRAMTARIFHTLEENPAAVASNFTDVARNFWYTNAIDWASATGVISGYGNGAFGPNDSVTKEQLAMMLYKYAQSKGYDVSMSAELKQADVSFWAVEAVEWAVEIGVLTENDAGYVVATEAASRADVAEAFMAFLNYYA